MDDTNRYKDTIILNGHFYKFAGVDYTPVNRNEPDVVYVRYDSDWEIVARLPISKCEKQKVLTNRT